MSKFRFDRRTKANKLTRKCWIRSRYFGKKETTIIMANFDIYTGINHTEVNINTEKVNNTPVKIESAWVVSATR